MKAAVASGFALLASAAFAFPAAAAICTPPAITIAPDGKSATALFSDMVVGTPAQVIPEDLTSTCDVAIPLVMPSGAVVLYSVDYRGFAGLPAGQTMRLSVDDGFAGTEDRIDGAFADNFTFTHRIAGRNGTVDSRIVLSLLTSEADSLANLDTLDVIQIGFTTFASVQESLDRLAAQRTAVATHLAATADLLLGVNQPFNAPSGAGLLAAFGSATIGVQGRYNFNDRLTLLGGAAFVKQSVAGTEAGGAVLLAGAARYVLPARGMAQPFVEGGLYGSPSLALAFTRDYLNGSGTGAASGALFGVYGRGGVVLNPAPADEVVLSASLAHNWLQVGAYSEAGGAGNLFPANIAAGTATGATAKAAAAWTRRLSDTLEFTLNGAVGAAFANSDVLATVDWVGPVVGSVGATPFFQAGARLGWSPTPGTTIDGFVLATSGPDIGTHAQFGGSVKVKF